MTCAAPVQEVKHVPLGQMRLSHNGATPLGTRALGSCVAVAMRDATRHVPGLAHCILPLSQLDTAMAQVEPCTFTDTGISALRDALLQAGARMENLQALLAGGASLLGDQSTLRMGARNLDVARMLLEQFDIPLLGESAGGSLPRSVAFHGAEGWMAVYCAGAMCRLECT